MVSGAPRSRLYEIDNTETWSEQSGLGVYLGLPAKAGRLEPMYVSNLQALKDEYTVAGKFTAEDDVAFTVAKRIINTTGLGLIVNRVANTDVLYGGCTVPCGTTKTASPLSVGLASPEDITFINTDADSNEQIQVQFRNDINGNTGGTAFFLQGQEDIITFVIEATQETNSYTVTNGDVNNSMNNRFIILPGGFGYVWFNVNSLGVDPAANTTSIQGLTAYEVALETNAEPKAIAEAINTALAAAEGITSEIVEDTTVKVTVNDAGVSTAGSSGSSGFKFIRNAIGYDEIKGYNTQTASVYDITITRNMKAEDIAKEVFTKLTTDETLKVTYTTTLKDNSLNIVSVTSGPVANAVVVEESPAPVVIKTLKQGSHNSGSDVLLLYFNNPSEKANNYGIKLYNSEDYPNIAPEDDTFVIEVYTKSNAKTPESTVTCSRNPSKMDSYNNTMYVVDVLEKLTNIRAVDNTEIASNELPRSITEILWFNGGDSGSEPTLSNYIDAAQPMLDKEQYSISLLLPGGYYATAYLQELDRIASKRGEAVLITGCPTNYEKSVNYLKLLPQWMNDEVLLTDSYASVFSPALKAYDSDMGKNIELPVECAVAEQIAFANENYSISQPVLGFTRGTLQNIQGVIRKYKFEEDGTADGDILYDNRINPIRFFNNQGYVIWGQKTTQTKVSARDRLNVRLMLTALKPLLNSIQLSLIGELPTQATRKRAEGLIKSVFDTGAARYWFKDDYSFELVQDASLEAQHIQRINYQVTPYNAIEYVNGYITLQNGVVTSIS